MTIAAFLFVCALAFMAQWQIRQINKRVDLLRDVMLSYEMGPLFDALEGLSRLNPDDKHWRWNGEPVTWHEFCDRLEGLDSDDT